MKKTILITLLAFLLSQPVFAELVRVVVRDSGDVTIITAMPQARKPGESDTEFYERIFFDTMQKDSSLTGRVYKDIDRSELPVSRLNRNKWRLNNGKVAVDVNVPDPPKTQAELDIQAFKDKCTLIKADALASLHDKDLCGVLLKVIK